MKGVFPFHFIKSFTLALFLAGGGFSPLRGGQESFETDADYSFVGGARMQNGAGEGTVSEQSNLLRCVLSSEVDGGSLIRTGVEWQRYSFSSAPSSLMMPNTLQSLSLVLGVDTDICGWLIRIEAQPGFYGDFNDSAGKCFNVPFIVGGSYLMGEDLQWVVGVSVNVERNLPVLPAAGVRWKFADHWVADAVLPRPRFEYLLNNSTTLYTGGDFKLGTYRMGSDFGTEHNQNSLNNAIVNYTEIRVGCGVEVKASSSVKIDFETGCMVYRQFDYDRANTTVGNDTGGAYGQIIVNLSF